MCYGCYLEYGSPTEKPKNYKELLAFIQTIYTKSEVGGGLHIVLDDWNLEDEHIKWYIENANLDSTELKCAELLLALPLKQRAVILALHEGHLT